MAVSGSDIVDFAKKYIGTPYVWGGNSLTSGVDCSGLVQQVYKHFGLSVSRTTYTQIGEGKAVKMNQLQAGDMVFFDTNPAVSGPDHVGLYIGNGKMIEAPKPGEAVRITDITNGYYQQAFMGGRRISGITGGGPADSWSPGGDGSTKLSPEELAAQYGWAYGFLNSNPELKGLFGQAVSGTWSADKFQAELRNTKWWKENSDSMRQAAVSKSTDPATYNAKVAATKVQVLQLAGEMGAAIPAAKLGKIVESAVNTNLDEDGLRMILGQYVTFTNKGTLNGEAGMYEHVIKETAYNQGVSLDDQTIKNQAQLIAKKLATTQDFQNQLADQAASMYPTYAPQLKAGETMMDIASPYIQQMAQNLEIPSTAIDLTDPLIKQALNGVNENGKPTGMDTTTFQNVIRSDPRWAKTTNAQNGVMNTGLRVLQDMGLVAKGS